MHEHGFSAKLPAFLTGSNFEDQAKAITIPLPVIATSPNDGVTIGGLAAILIHDRQDKVSTLVAPQINHNRNFGVTTTLYGDFHPCRTAATRSTCPSRPGSIMITKSRLRTGPARAARWN